ncbi:MAG: hypothetical protein QNK37_02275 [Acidobacteriota bacterium]|nr:hypothetical protein [Acidobacteriota bacterium]
MNLVDVFVSRIPIQLESNDFIPIVAVAPLEDNLLVVGADDSGFFFHEFTVEGKKIRSFGKRGQGPGDFEVPGWPTWDPYTKELWIYDPYVRQFNIFDRAGKFKQRRPQSEDVYLENHGKFIPMGNHRLFLVDAAEGLWNLTLLLRNDFAKRRFGFALSNHKAAKLNDRFFTIDADHLVFDKKVSVIAVENLVPKVHILDLDLKKRGVIPIGLPGWKHLDMAKALTMGDHPMKVENYRDEYTEILAIKALTEGCFVAVYRNVSAYETMMQCFHITGKKLGGPFKSNREYIGLSGSTIFLIDPDDENMQLHPVEVRR